jgi:hypothetical protein
MRLDRSVTENIGGVQRQGDRVSREIRPPIKVERSRAQVLECMMQCHWPGMDMLTLKSTPECS